MTDFEREKNQAIDRIANEEIKATLKRIYMAGARAGRKQSQAEVNILQDKIHGLEAEVKYWRGRACEKL